MKIIIFKRKFNILIKIIIIKIKVQVIGFKKSNLINIQIKIWTREINKIIETINNKKIQLNHI